MKQERPKHDIARLDEIAKILDRAKPIKNSILSTKDAVLRLKKNIRNIQKKGYDFEQISKILEENGIKIKPATLKLYLRDNKANNKAADKE